jgi:hypothetical protein
VALQDQPFQVLALLLRHHGEVVTREALQRALWPADTFIEFEHGINTAIKKLRQALGDTADNPRFIETLPKKGYRFIAPVNDLVVEARTPRRRWRWWVVGTGLAVLAVASVFWLTSNLRRVSPVPLPVPLTSTPGRVEWATFSPDGDRIAFTWGPIGEEKRHIYVKQIGAEQTIRLTGDSTDDCSAEWSPDGRWIAFQRGLPSGAQALYKIAEVGGRENRRVSVGLGTIRMASERALACSFRH